MLRKLSWGLVAAVLVYVGLRWLILFTAFDQTAMTMYELYPMGTLPKVLLEGADVPLRLYYDNAAGQILTGLVAVPYYALLGDSYLTLKLVPATFGLGTVLLIYALLREHFGRRAAVFGALLFALGPVTTVTKYSLMASGNHFENLFFTTAALYCSYRLHAGGDRRVWLPLAGFSAGFAVFVFLGAIIPIGLLALLFLGVRGWRGTLRDFKVVLPAIALGLAPLLYLNLSTSGRGLSFLTKRFGEAELREQGVLERVGVFLFQELPRAGFFDELLGISPRVPNLAFVACFALAWLAALPAALVGLWLVLRRALAAEHAPAAERETFERAKLFPFVIYLPLTALAFGISDLLLANHTPPIECAGYRYYLPTFLFAVLLIAVLAGAPAGSWRRPAGTLAGVVALLTGLWNLSYVDFGFATPNLGAHYRGYNFVQAARGLSSPKNGLSEEQMRAAADQFRPPFRHQLYTGLGFNRAGMQYLRRNKRGRGDADFLDLDELLAGFPPDVHLDMLRGAGTFARFESMIESRPELVTGPLATLYDAGDPRAERVAEGASSSKEYAQVLLRTPRMLEEAMATLRSIDARVQPAYARGCGLLCGRLLRREIPAEERLVEAFLRSAPTALADELLRGLGWGLADGAEEPGLTEAARELVPPPRRAPVLAGYRAGVEHVHGPAAAEAALAALPAGWRLP